MFFRKRIKSTGLLVLFALTGNVSAAPQTLEKTPLVKLKKMTRTIITLVDKMIKTEVSDNDAERAVPVVEGQEHSRSNNRRQKMLKARPGKTMITDKIAGRWLKKTINVVKWTQRKYTGEPCQTYGEPELDDMYEVFSRKFFENYAKSDWKNYVEKLVLEPDYDKTVRGMTVGRLEKPLSTLYLNYAKLRLWVNENLSKCYVKEKVDAMKEKKRVAKGVERINNWDNIATKKFERLEKRLCKNINEKFLVRTTQADNPYFDNPSCNATLFKQKQRDAVNEDRKREKDEARAAKAAAKQAKKNKKKKNKA